MAKISTLIQDFPGPSYPADWVQSDIYVENPSTIWLDDGLRYDGDGTYALTTIYKSTPTYDLTSSRIYFNLESSSGSYDSGSSNYWGLFGVYGTNGDWIGWHMDDNVGFYPSFSVTNYWVNKASASYAPKSGVLLSIREASGTIYWEYSDDDGASWTSVYSAAKSSLLDVGVGAITLPLTEVKPAINLEAIDSSAGFVLLGINNVAPPALPPTVTLSSPVDDALIGVTNPSLQFTGTDPQDEDITYQLELETLNNGHTVGGSILAIGGSSSPTRARGQSFMGDGLTVKKILFEMAKVDSTTGYIYVKIYAHSGTFGSNGVPTGEPIAVSSNSIDASGLSTSFEWMQFDFDYQTDDGVPYFAVLDASDIGGENMRLRFGGTSSMVGNGASSNTSDLTVWSSHSYRINFQVFTSLSEESSTSADFNNLTTPADEDPFNSGELIAYQGLTLVEGVYNWRVRAKAPSALNEWGEWSSLREFTIQLSVDTDSSRSARIKGRDTSNSQRSAITTGKASQQENRTATLVGRDISNNQRPANLLGYDIDGEQRNATLTGFIPTVNTEKQSIMAGGDGWHRERFENQTNMDASSTASWGDGKAGMQ